MLYVFLLESHFPSPHCLSIENIVVLNDIESFFFFNTKYENQISDFSFQQVKKGNSKPSFF